MKKMGKTIRSFRYDLNKILYDYTVEMMNGFEGLDMVDRVPEELWMKMHTRGSDQNHPKEKEMQEGEVVV